MERAYFDRLREGRPFVIAEASEAFSMTGSRPQFKKRERILKRMKDFFKACDATSANLALWLECLEFVLPQRAFRVSDSFASVVN